MKILFGKNLEKLNKEFSSLNLECGKDGVEEINMHLYYIDTKITDFENQKSIEILQEIKKESKIYFDKCYKMSCPINNNTYNTTYDTNIDMYEFIKKNSIITEPLSIVTFGYFENQIIIHVTIQFNKTCV